MDLGTQRDTERERREREKEKGKDKRKGKKGKEKGREEGKGKSYSGKKNWWHEHHDQRWMEPFRGYCGHSWKWGHNKAQCRQWQGCRPLELGAMVSHPSQTVVSDPGSSVSQRVQAVNSSPVSPICSYLCKLYAEGVRAPLTRP